MILMGFILNGFLEGCSYEEVSIQHGEPIEGKSLHFHGGNYGSMSSPDKGNKGFPVEKAGEESGRNAG